VTEVTCLPPPVSSQPTATTSPGWYLAMIPVSEPGVVTGRPSTEVITSPGARPCAWAAVPHSTPMTSAPAPAGAMSRGTAGCWPPVRQAAPSPPLPAPPGKAPPPGCRAAAACRRGSGLPLRATSTPRKPGSPMSTAGLARPRSICLAMASASLTGIAKPMVAPPRPGWPGPAVSAAVIIPMTVPALSASAPPESPCWICAVVCSMSCRSSVVPDPASLAWMERPTPLMTPAAGVTPPRPPALPRASTAVPTATRAESPKLTGVSPEAPCSRSSATSAVAS
jgi:hypothetical protein